MKNKVIWFVIGFITASLLTMKLLGQVKGYEEHQKVLESLVCQIPKEQLQTILSNVELPSDVKYILGNNANKAQQEYRDNIYNECYAI
mmetsp:Transcript_3064/g.4491  ORF Transcript_3064/g.4491 Transcript_3064/m.4491 type:complete len:88 (-) Transcript_3064:212-475(-)